jgi:hypothetical protein
MRSLILVVAVAACGHHTSVPPGVDGPLPSSLICESTHQPFPQNAYDKTCSTVADCTIVDHMISCCGTMRAIGLRTSAVAAFTPVEQDCESHYPGCGCASGPTQAEDGRTSIDGTILVACTPNGCATFVP